VCVRTLENTEIQKILLILFSNLSKSLLNLSSIQILFLGDAIFAGLCIYNV